MVEERVRLCQGCNAIVGWFALFCEQCGAPQKPPPKVAPESAPDALAGTPSPLAARRAEAALAAPPEDADARTLSRDLFQVQLRLIHRNREQAEALAAAVERVAGDLRNAERQLRGADRRAALDRLSERLVDAESQWEELQRTYNRESEEIEEECRDRMESAGIDAYLTPDENMAIDAEFRALTERFEAVDAALHQCGQALAYGRKRAQSRYFGLPAGSPAAFFVLASVSVALLGCSFWLLARSPGTEAAATLKGLAPAAVAVLLVLGFAAARR